MGLPAIGAVVLINFPFADLKGYKKRPAVVIAYSSLETVILCQITSRQLSNVPAIVIAKEDFASGSLPSMSYIRPDKLFTVDASMAEQNQLGVLMAKKIDETRAAIRQLFD